MTHDLLQLEDLFDPSLVPVLPQPDPSIPISGGCANTEASDIAEAFGFIESGPVCALVHSMSFGSYARSTNGLRETIDYKVNALENCGGLMHLFGSARQCLEPDRRFGALLLLTQMMDLYGPGLARELMRVIMSLSRGINLRTQPLEPEDPLTLDVLTEALLHCLRQGKPEASPEDAFSFVQEMLAERWPASEMSIRASVERMLNED